MVYVFLKPSPVAAMFARLHPKETFSVACNAMTAVIVECETAHFCDGAVVIHFLRDSWKEDGVTLRKVERAWVSLDSFMLLSEDLTEDIREDMEPVTGKHGSIWWSSRIAGAL